MGGATEATLAELLAAAQAMNVNLIKLQSLFSKMTPGGGTAGAGGGIAGFATSVAAATPMMKALNIATGLVSGIFETLGGIVGKVIDGFTGAIKGIVDFSKKAMEGTARVSDFYNSFKDLPFFIGTLSGIFASLIKYAEGLLDTYRLLSQQGASFSGNLVLLKETASKAYLSLNEFAGIVSKNADIFAKMGGNVESGINKFVSVQEKLLGPDSDYGKKMLGMGMSFEEVGNSVTWFMKRQGSAANMQMMSIDEITKGTYEYAKELDTLSKFTGKRREQIQKEVEETESEEAWQQFLASISSPEVREAYAAGVTNLATIGGKEVANRFKLQARGIEVPMTEAQKSMEVTTQGLMSITMQSLDAAAKQGVSIEQMGVLAREGMDRNGKAINAYWKGNEPVYAVLSAQNKSIAVAGSQMQAFARQNVNLSKTELELRAKRAQLESSSAQALSTAERSIREFGARIFGIVAQFISPLIAPLSDFSTEIMKTASEFMKTDSFKRGVETLKNTIISIVGWFETAFKELKQAYSEGGFSGAFRKLIDKLFEGAGNIWAKIKPWWLTEVQPALLSMVDSIVKTLTPYLQQALDKIMDTINEWVYNRTSGMIGENPKELAKKRALENKQRDLDKQIRDKQELIEALQAQAKVSGGTVDNKTQIDALLAEIQRLKSTSPPPRALGTLGMTGNWWEKEDATLRVHKGESVVTPSQMSQITNNPDLVHNLQKLNGLTTQLLSVMKSTAENTERTVTALNNLRPNYFKCA